MSDDGPALCTYVVDPALGKQCSSVEHLWDVFYRVGTGRLLEKKPYIRCWQHLGATVEALAEEAYPYYLERVERHGSPPRASTKDPWT